VTQLTLVNNVVTNTNVTFDTCLASTLLVEASCQNNQLATINYICPNGCSNGACINVTQSVTGIDFSILPPISITPGQLVEGNSMNFTAIVQNIGNVAANYNGTTRFRIDLNNDGSWNVLHEASGSQLSASVSSSLWTWIAIAGTHKVEACADANNVITESNETNNCEFGIFAIAASGGGAGTNATQWNWLANANSNYSTTLLSWTGIATVPSAATKIAIALWEGEEERTLNGDRGNYNINFTNNTCTRSNSPWSNDVEGECIIISDLNSDFIFDNNYPTSLITECDIRYTASTRLLEFRDISTLSDCGYTIYVLGASVASPAGNFVGSDFVCERIQNRNTCTIDYTTNLTGAVVLFTMFDSDGVVTQTSNTVISSLSGIATGNLFCSTQVNRTFNAEWIVYSDSTLTTPIKWVRSSEILQVLC
jgi:hypothetical protein